MKKCLGCGGTFHLTPDNFYPRKTKQGFYSYCISCHKDMVSKTYRDNKEEINKRKQKHYLENRDKLLAEQKVRWMKRKESDPIGYKAARDATRKKHIKAAQDRDKKYHLEHKERRNAYTREYYNQNKKELNEKGRLYLIERRRGDEQYRMFVNLRRRMATAMQENYKRGKMIDLLGCSISDLKQFLETQFREGMTWGNYGRTGWHIDHVVPCASFDLSNTDQQKICFNYRNLRPLWAKDNLVKGSRMEGTHDNLTRQTYVAS